MDYDCTGGLLLQLPAVRLPTTATPSTSALSADPERNRSRSPYLTAPSVRLRDWSTAPVTHVPESASCTGAPPRCRCDHRHT